MPPTPLPSFADEHGRIPATAGTIVPRGAAAGLAAGGPDALAEWPALVWTTDADLRIASWSGTESRTEAASGTDSPVGRTWIELTSAEPSRPRTPEDAEPLEHPWIAAHLRTLAGEPFGGRLAWRGRTWQVRLAPIRAAGGTEPENAVVGVRGVALPVDPTEEPLVSDVVQQILDNTTAVIYAKDVQGRYLLINRRFEELFHITKTQVLGRTDFEVFAPEMAEAFRVNDRRVLALGRAVQFEEIAPHDDGPHTYVSVKFPYFDRTGRTLGIGGISTDIADRKRMEQGLRLRDRALQSTAAGVLITDPNLPDNPVSFCNPAFERMTGYAAEEIVGRNCRFLQGDDGDQPGARLLRAAIRERRECRVVLRNYRKDGTPFWNELTIAPVDDEQGRLVHFVGVAHDVTARLAAEEESRRHREELAVVSRRATMGEMASLLAHELNQPLTAIVAFLRGCRLRLAAGDFSPEELRRILDAAADQALRGGEIIKRIRRHVRRNETARRPVRLDETAREIVAFLGNEAQLHGVRIEVVAAPGLPPVHADEIELEQVLVNLVLNALEAVADVPVPRRRIRIELAAEKDEAVEVRVIDQGVGIAPENAARLFDRFFTTKPHGMGMGLAMCRSIAESLGGRLDLVANPEFGATARMRLPTAASRPTAAPGTGDQPAAAAVPVQAPGPPVPSVSNASPVPAAPPAASGRGPRGRKRRQSDGANRLLPDREEVR